MRDDLLQCAQTRRVSRRRWLALVAAVGLAVQTAMTLAQAPPPPGLAPPAKPTAMPAFELPTTEGGTLRSESLRGEVVVIRFWASW